MSIVLEKKNIVAATTDAVVNAANEQLLAGGGVCGAIFAAAGYRDLTKACQAIGHCSTGSAVITPGFALSARYIIHAVGPVWHGGNRGERQLLRSCYTASCQLAEEHQLSSITFPLISAGIFGVPIGIAWEEALQATKERNLAVHFAILDERILAAGNEVRRQLGI